MATSSQAVEKSMLRQRAASAAEKRRRQQHKDDEDGASASAASCSSAKRPRKGKAKAKGSLSSSPSPAPDLCPICMVPFSADRPVGVPDTCDHVFCADCLLTWCRTSNTCPTDRQVLQAVTVHPSVEKRHVLLKWHKVRAPEPEKRLQAELEALYEAGDPEPECFCETCGSGDMADRLLLCDGCDLGHHTHCLDPPLERLPPDSESWFCPTCVGVGLGPSASAAAVAKPPAKSGQGPAATVPSPSSFQVQVEQLATSLPPVEEEKPPSLVEVVAEQSSSKVEQPTSEDEQSTSEDEQTTSRGKKPTSKNEQPLIETIEPTTRSKTGRNRQKQNRLKSHSTVKVRSEAASKVEMKQSDEHAWLKDRLIQMQTTKISPKGKKMKKKAKLEKGQSSRMDQTPLAEAPVTCTPKAKRQEKSAQRKLNLVEDVQAGHVLGPDLLASVSAAANSPSESVQSTPTVTLSPQVPAERVPVKADHAMSPVEEGQSTSSTSHGEQPMVEANQLQPAKRTKRNAKQECKSPKQKVLPKSCEKRKKGSKSVLAGLLSHLDQTLLAEVAKAESQHKITDFFQPKPFQPCDIADVQGEPSTRDSKDVHVESRPDNNQSIQVNPSSVHVESRPAEAKVIQVEDSPVGDATDAQIKPRDWDVTNSASDKVSDAKKSGKTAGTKSRLQKIAICVKHELSPFFKRNLISKSDYNYILEKSTSKVYTSAMKSSNPNLIYPARVKKLVEAYVKLMHRKRRGK